MHNAKIIAICNQKCGVGKTTTTVNRGVGLAMQSKKVLLVEVTLHHDEGVDLVPVHVKLSALELSIIGAMSREVTMKYLYIAVNING